MNNKKEKVTEHNKNWGGRIRTYESRDQNPMPYRLATPQWLSRPFIKAGDKNIIKQDAAGVCESAGMLSVHCQKFGATATLGNLLQCSINAALHRSKRHTRIINPFRF